MNVQLWELILLSIIEELLQHLAFLGHGAFWHILPLSCTQVAGLLALHPDRFHKWLSVDGFDIDDCVPLRIQTHVLGVARAPG